MGRNDGEETALFKDSQKVLAELEPECESPDAWITSRGRISEQDS